jgi:hypothetical protein
MTLFLTDEIIGVNIIRKDNALSGGIREGEVKMGHIIFILLHLAAIICGFVFLFITIPLHLIYAAIKSKSKRTKVQKATDKALNGYLDKTRNPEGLKIHPDWIEEKEGKD